MGRQWDSQKSSQPNPNQEQTNHPVTCTHNSKVQVPTPSADLLGRLFDFYLGPEQEDDDDEEGGQRFIM